MSPLVNEIISSVVFGLLAIIMMILGYKIIDWVIPADLSKEIEKGNIAAAIVIAGVFIAVAIIIGMAVS